MKFRKTIIGAILAAVISISAIAPCNIAYAETSKTAEVVSEVPVNFKATKTATSITLKWDEVKGADGYRVYMKNPTSGKYEKYKSVTKNSCKVTGLKSGTKYYFKVSVLVKNGEKYKEKANSKSKAAAFTTKTSDTKSTNSSIGKKTITTLLNIKIGTSEKTVLEKLDIKNYKKVGEPCLYVDASDSSSFIRYTEEQYKNAVEEGYSPKILFKTHGIQSEITFKWKNDDYKSTIYLDFKDNKLASWRLSIPCPEDNDDLYDEIKEYIEKLFSDTYKQTDYGYLNIKKDDYIGISQYYGNINISRSSFDFMFIINDTSFDY